jgi:hypothetical protein
MLDWLVQKRKKGIPGKRIGSALTHGILHKVLVHQDWEVVVRVDLLQVRYVEYVEF